MKTLLIVNPKAGRMRIRNGLFRIVERLSLAGCVPTVCVTGHSGHAAELAAGAGDFELIVCTGGDGTLSEVISGLVTAGLDIPIGYIPLGSTNDLAMSLGIGQGIDAALDGIIKGVPRPLDVGSFNGRYFTDAAFFGALSRVSYGTPQNMKNTFGFLAYVLEGIKDLPNIRPVRMEVEAAGRRFEGDYLISVVSNSRTLGGLVPLDEGLVSTDDGMFELMLVEYTQSPAKIRGCVHALRTGRPECDGIVFLSAPSITLRCDTDEPWTLDGERADWDGRADIKILPRAVRLMLR